MSKQNWGNTRTWRAVIQIVLTLILSLLGKKAGKSVPRTETPKGRPGSKRASSADSDIAELFASRTSDTIVTASGLVVKILPEDRYDDDGSGQHQQFLVEVTRDLTVKVAHNIKFGRVPVREGDTVGIKGEYEWNDRGGCIHWTHHDPKGWHEDGWIEHRGKRYG